MPPRFLYNDPSFKRRRQKLRNKSTSAELILWSQLRGKQLLGLKFQRQYGVGPFVLDFFCPKLRLAIEVDGPSHFMAEAQTYDFERQCYLETHDIIVVRFLNSDVIENIDGVMEALQQKVKGLVR